MDCRNDEPKQPLPQECSVRVDLCFPHASSLCEVQLSEKSTQHIYDPAQ